VSGRARLALILVAALGLVVAARLLPIGEWLGGFQRWVADQGAWGGVLYGIAYTAAALLFVPGSVLTLGAGALFGVVWGTVIVSLASTAAAAAAFLIARYLARARVARAAARNRTFGAIDRGIGRRGWKVVALLRLSPLVPFSLSNYLYGLTPVAFGPYVLASWIAMLPATVLYVSLGAAGRAAASGATRGPLEWTLLGVGLLATVLVTFMVSRAARRELGAEFLADNRQDR
jgi:uncharacterized membrane protein YdjX (TVP38/TMEM64 family)